MTSLPDEPSPAAPATSAASGPRRDVAPPVRSHSPAYPLLPMGLGLLFAGQLLAGIGVLRTLSELSSYYPESQSGWLIIGGLCVIVGAIMVIVGAGRLTSHIDDLHLTLLRPAPGSPR